MNDNKLIAEAFRKFVNDKHNIAVARVALFAEEEEERRNLHGKIEDDVKGSGKGSFSVVMLDEVNNIAVLEDHHAAKKGPYKYISALLSPKTEKWYTTSSYDRGVHLAYVRGVSEMFLGRNNELATFFERMLIEVKD